MLNSAECIAGSLENIAYVGMEAVYQGKWVLCYHRDRKSWEFPGGHVEPGEFPLAAAKRELWEETGAVDFDIVPVWDFEAFDEDGRKHNNGRTYYVVIREFEPLSADSEMERIGFFDSLPEDVTYDRTEMTDLMARAKRYAEALYQRE